ncbi:MAG TPA: VOC family protein [Candidatus Sulfotelmatobacter sp.]|jgi:PhnB protein|nr:VOC family protein [Candidatus Sulfotelmatobacter sp.]
MPTSKKRSNKKKSKKNSRKSAARSRSKAAPSITTTIAPWLCVRGGARAVEFYKAAFGAIELFLMGEGDSVVARLSIQGAEFWLSDESPEHHNYSPESLGGITVRIILTVPDPDAVFARAVKAGAKEVYPVTEEHDWRIGRVVDPFGHHWEIGRPLS